MSWRTRLASWGGYFTALSESELKGRLPPEKLPSFIAFVESQGAVIDRSHVSTDMTFTLSDLRARLTAAETTMQELSKLLRDLPSHALTEVRAELARRIAEIERFRGQIRLTETNLQFADVTIAFQFQNSEIPPPPSVSSFVWLNSLGVDQLMQAVGSER